MTKLLITGGCGFIGSNFIRYMLAAHPDYHIVNLDALTYAGNPENLLGIPVDANYTFIRGDITDPQAVGHALDAVDSVIHFAAESHVDRSIQGPEAFTKTNVLGTQVLLDFAKEKKIRRFIHVSTDEVYGSLGPVGYFTENTPLAPNSPYAASKAGSDLLCRSYFETFKFPVIITRCSNNYGPYQFPEKLIPLMITRALDDQPLPVYGDGMNVRDWLYVEDHCRALDAVLHTGKDGSVYNIGGRNERHNIDIVKLILKELRKPESLIQFVDDRLGHDRRYAIDAAKIEHELGWKPSTPFEDGIRKTVQWYVANQSWIETITTGKYRA